MGSSSPRFGPDADLDVLSHEDALVHFDACVRKGAIRFDYDFLTKIHTVDGIDFEFRISKALQTKPNTTSDPLASTVGASSTPRPGSDLMTAGTEVAALGETHFLAFNAFACYRPHYLILTNDGYRRQWEPLDEDDFTAAHALLDSRVSGEKKGRGDYLVFFNGGPEAACSRVHKHLQAIPQESFDGDPWRNLDRGVLPFAYFEERFGADAEFSPETSLRAYERGLDAIAKSVGAVTLDSDGKKRAPAHNILLDRERLVVIPRIAAGAPGVGANAAGVLGMLWLPSEESLQQCLDVGPQNVLHVAGVAKLS